MARGRFSGEKVFVLFPVMPKKLNVSLLLNKVESQLQRRWDQLRMAVESGWDCFHSIATTKRELLI
eukprot:649512-Hanusia_phi.AAC.1